MKLHSLSLRQFFRTALTFVAAMAVTLTVGAAPALDDTHANVKAVMAVQNDVTPGLMQFADVLGTAVGLDDAGRPCLVVYLDKDGPAADETVRGLAGKLRGVGLKVEKTDKIRAFAGKGNGGGGGGGVSHTAPQALPIPLGTSGGWQLDLANGYCCGGTLGALVSVNGVQYILSNYHVLEADIVSGGNGVVATTSQPVIHPALIDVNCNANNAQNVATLVKLSSLPGSNVDAAVAAVSSGTVRADGAILEIGTISSQTVAAALSQAVKKSGRTSGLTRSKVSGLNATIRVSYENECAGGAAFSKTFSGQIVIANTGSKFLKSGDSGSLVVQDVTTNPQAVGLLFAGSSTTAIANPIGQVLTFIGGKLGGTATMVGN
jgi:hypothetical protein